MSLAVGLTVSLLIVLAIGLVLVHNLLDFGGPRGLPFLIGHCLAYSNAPFNAETWRDQPEPQRRIYPSPRYSMARSLVKDHLRRDVTIADVKTLLGPPDSVHNNAGIQPTLEYCLGVPFGDMPYRDMYIYLVFDPTGRYMGYSIYYESS